jgi:PAS domain S-box-containing protein
VQWNGYPLFDEEGQYAGFQVTGRDITEQKRALQALRESEEKYRRLVHDSIDGIVIAHGLEVRFVNPALLKMLGCEREEEMVGRPFTDFISPEHRELMAGRGRAREEGQDEPERYEFKALRKDGSEVYAELSVSRITYEGRVARQAIVRDISERKRAEEELRRREQEMRVIANSVPALFSYVDADGRYRFVNKRYEEWFGIPLAGIIGKHYREILGEATYDVVKDCVEAALAGQRVCYEQALPYAHGGTRWVTADYVPDTDEQGKVKGFFALVTDISERKRAEEALRESEEKYRRLVQDSIDGIVIVEGLEIRFVNRVVLKMLGCEHEGEVVGRPFTDFVAPEYRKLMVERGLAREKGEDVVDRYEFKVLRRDGSEFDAEISVGLITYQGRLARQTIVRDISERKRAEEALQKARDELESRVERRMQQVNGYGLTFRELTVLHLVAAGESDKEIAAVLGISPLTAHKHLANILEKMGAACRTEAGVRALREGLLD